MTPAEMLVLDAVHRAGVMDQFRVTMHAREHEDDRNVFRADIRAALRTATSARAQSNGRWRIEGGRDSDGDDLTVIVVLEHGVVVVTVF